MNDKLFLKSRELYEDKEELKKCIKEHEKASHWIGVKTPDNTCVFSAHTQEKFIKKLKELLCEIEGDFAELE